MALLIFINGWLLSRMVFTFLESPLANRPLMALLGVQLLLVALLAPAMESLLLLGTVPAALFLSERWLAKNWLNEARLLSLILVMGITAFLQREYTPDLWFTPLNEPLGITPEPFHRFLWILFGFLLLANEANLIIRGLLRRFQLEPLQQGSDGSERKTRALDQREYNAGRIIGILERWLIYLVLVIEHNYNVIALVLAAKGFARFRQLEQREFAEYVLIGTLAFTLLTVIVSQVIAYLPLADLSFNAG